MTSEQDSEHASTGEDEPRPRASWFRPLYAIVPLLVSLLVLFHHLQPHPRLGHRSAFGVGLPGAIPLTSLDELTDFLASETDDLSRRFAFEELRFERTYPRLTRRAQATLDGIAVALAASPKARIAVEAHGDAPVAAGRGPAPSLAGAIKDGLVARGLDPDRITVILRGQDDARATRNAYPGTTEIVVCRR